MADRSFTQIGEDVVGTVARLIKIPQMSTSDTITMGDMNSVTAVTLYKTSDMSTTVTTTIATNVITLTSTTLTNIPLVGIITGTLKK